MNTIRRPPLSSLHFLETEYSVRGPLRSRSPAAHAIALRLRYEGRNYRKSRALSFVGETDSLEELKCLIASGHSEVAEIAWKTLTKSALRDSELDPEIRADLAVQGSRCATLLGDWALALSRVRDAEQAGGLSSLSRLTLLQIQALAHLELGEIERADKALRNAELVHELYPRAPSAFYIRVLRAKIALRSEREDGVESFLLPLWAEIAHGPSDVNYDQLLALLRLEIEIARLRGQSALLPSIAAYLVADRLGDELYAALAWLDVSVERRDAGDPDRNSRLASAIQEHPRVARLWAELSSESTSETARLLRRGKTRALNDSRPLYALSSVTTHREIYLLRHGIRISLTSGAVRKVAALTSRSFGLIAPLSSGAYEKSELFREVWGLSNYLADRHDTVIRTALRRLRQESGLDVYSEQGRIALGTDTLVVL